MNQLFELLLVISGYQLMPSYRSPQTPRGFTLVEVMVVLVLVALLGTIVGVSLSRAAQTARLEDVLGSIDSFDSTTREQARRFRQPVRMALNLDLQTISRVESIMRHSVTTHELNNRIFAIPQGFRMAHVLYAGEEVSGGETEILISSLGHTQSFAIRVERVAGELQTNSPATESSSWICIAGLTGQSIRVPHEEEARQLLGSFAATTTRHDAD